VFGSGFAACNGLAEVDGGGTFIEGDDSGLSSGPNRIGFAGEDESLFEGMFVFSYD
jgi:hypothetical protein